MVLCLQISFRTIKQIYFEIELKCYISWYTVMKQNCERLDRIAASTKQVKLLAACSKAFISNPAKPESQAQSEPNFDDDNKELR